MKNFNSIKPPRGGTPPRTSGRAFRGGGPPTSGNGLHGNNNRPLGGGRGFCYGDNGPLGGGRPKRFFHLQIMCLTSFFQTMVIKIIFNNKDQIFFF